MNKLKIQNFNNLPNYQHFLKNNSLKKKRFKLKNILFENQILYKDEDLNIIEYTNSENLQIPITVLDLKDIGTIQSTYKNHLLFNYNLNYNILYNFNKIMFNYIKKKKNIIKGRLTKGSFKKSVIAFLGFTFPMKAVNLNTLIFSKKRFYPKKHKKKFFFSYKYRNLMKKKRNKKTRRIINSYKLRYLNYKIEKNKNILSRVSCVEDIIKYRRIKNLKKRIFLERIKKKKTKSNLSRKGYVKKLNKIK